MDEIQRRFSAMQWLYAEQDPAALEELERRTAQDWCRRHGGVR